MKRSLRPKPLVPTPDELWRFLVRRLPLKFANLVLTVLSLLAWITLPLNFLSQISQIAIVAEAFQHLLERAGQLRPLLDAAVDAVRPAVLAWRELVAPLKDWISSQFPWMPSIIFDVLVILGLCAPPIFQWIMSGQEIRSLVPLIKFHIGLIRGTGSDDWQRDQWSSRELREMLRVVETRVNEKNARFNLSTNDFFNLSGASKYLRRFLRAKRTHLSARILIVISMLFVGIVLVLNYTPV